MLLAIDTATEQVGIALTEESRVVAEEIWYSQRHHTVELAPAVAETLRRADVTARDLEGIAVTTGPGSFTALRVGLALAKGMVAALSIPLVGVPTLDVLAAGQPESELPLAAIVQAGRGRIAVVLYSSTDEHGRRRYSSTGPAIVMTVDALAKSIERPTLVAGELTTDERSRLARKKVNVVLAPPSACVRRPSVLSAIAWNRLRHGELDEPASLAPIYLHSADPMQA